MHRDFKLRRRLIWGGLGVLLLADLGLAAWSWRMAATPRTSDQEMAQRANQVKLLKADIDRVEKIRKDLPQTVADFDRFEKSLLPASTGYSVVSGELGKLAANAGLRMQGVSFHQAEIKGHPLLEIQMDAEVSGDYPGVVKFLNGLQRSPDVYVVDSLALATGTQGNANEIRVNLHMRTYFRSQA